MLTFYPSRTPDPGVKKAADSRSATLLSSYHPGCLSRIRIMIFTIRGQKGTDPGSGTLAPVVQYRDLLTPLLLNVIFLIQVSGCVKKEAYKVQKKVVLNAVLMQVMKLNIFLKGLSELRIRIAYRMRIRIPIRIGNLTPDP
jgi:hypothetical protein